MNDQLSPEIEALLAETAKKPSFGLSKIDEDESLGFQKENSWGSPKIDEKKDSHLEVDLSLTGFKPITEFFSSDLNPVFGNPNYYKTALAGETEAAQRFHTVLSKYLTSKDPKDRSVFRQQLNTLYWELVRSIAPKTVSLTIEEEKKMLLRFGLVLPSLLTNEQKDTFASVFPKNNTGEPVFYVDEWFRDIGNGKMAPSATDEARPTKKGSSGGNAEAQRLRQLQAKNEGKLQASERMLTAKERERSMLEIELKSKVDKFCEHPSYGNDIHKGFLTEAQKKLVPSIGEDLKSLLKIDREIQSYLEEYTDAKGVAESLEVKLQAMPEDCEVNTSDILQEIDTVRQMAKMTVGRQGNHFPLLTREFFHCMPRQTGYRENVIDLMAKIESIDPGAFCRVHKNNQNRIVPYVLLVPTYGDSGMCWEPFDRYNRVTSRGRIVVPMYPRNLEIALLTAVADLRWQVAKEKASYYWMEEGLTGQYYQWFYTQKLKGDVKEYFINDYILWMTKESEGVQRLEKDVRGVFWRHMPFSQEIKENLRTRSLVYQELYQRDLNRAMSDGY